MNTENDSEDFDEEEVFPSEEEATFLTKETFSGYLNSIFKKEGVLLNFPSEDVTSHVDLSEKISFGSNHGYIYGSNLGAPQEAAEDVDESVYIFQVTDDQQEYWMATLDPNDGILLIKVPRGVSVSYVSSELIAGLVDLGETRFNVFNYIGGVNQDSSFNTCRWFTPSSDEARYYPSSPSPEFSFVALGANNNCSNHEIEKQYGGWGLCSFAENQFACPKYEAVTWTPVEMKSGVDSDGNRSVLSLEHRRVAKGVDQFRSYKELDNVCDPHEFFVSTAPGSVDLEFLAQSHFENLCLEAEKTLLLEDVPAPSEDPVKRSYVKYVIG